MIIKLFDGTEILISQAQGAAASKALLQEAKFIQVKGMTLRTSAIAVIKPGGNTEADLVPKTRRLAAPDNRGTTSTAKELLRAKWSKHAPKLSTGKQETT